MAELSWISHIPFCDPDPDMWEICHSMGIFYIFGEVLKSNFQRSRGAPKSNLRRSLGAPQSNFRRSLEGAEIQLSHTDQKLI